MLRKATVTVESTRQNLEHRTPQMRVHNREWLSTASPWLNKTNFTLATFRADEVNTTAPEGR